ncbi:MAG TPA: PAS domain S-box protein [Anaerolineales bacterium]
MMSESIRILIVEDLAADAELAKREIRKVVKDCEFQCVETREGYLVAIETFQPDLILSDYHLPHFDGMKALSLALEYAPLTPLIIWTGSLSEDIAVDCMKAGANNYIIKENIKRLAPAVIHALEERRLLLERKRAEEKYQAIFENSPEGIFQSTPEGQFVSVNPAMARIYGYDSPREMIEGVTDISRQLYLDPTEREMFTGPLQWRGVIENFEWKNQRKDGSIIWTSTSARAVRDDAGNVRYYEGFLQDITERKQAEEALENNEKRFRALIENGLDNISLLAADGTLIWESPAVFRTLDYAPDEFLGQDIFELMHPDDLDWTRRLYSKIIQEPGSRQRGSFRLRHSNNTWRWVEAIVTNMLDEPGVNAIVVNYRDITERKQAEARINDLLVFNEKVLNNSPIGILTYKLTGECVLASENAASIIETSVEKLQAQNFHTVESWKKSGLYDLVEKAITSRVPVTSDIHHLSTFGKEVWLTAYAVTFKSKDEDHLLLTISDITERKQAETERQTLLEIMQGHANTSDLQEFLKLIHHSIARVIYSENFFTVLHNESSGLFEEIYSVDQYDEPEPPSKLEKSITSYVFRTGEPLLLTQTGFDELVAQGEVELVGTNSASWLGVPLKTPTETIGVIAVQDYENPSRYTERDKGFLASIAAQVALAIERKQAEEALQESEKRFRALIEKSRDVIILVQADGLITYVSPGIIDVLGYSVDEYVGKNGFEFIHPEDIERSAGLFAEALQKPGVAFTTLVRERHKDDSWRWLEGSITNLLAQPSVKALVANFHDITERKQAEEALHKSEQRHRALFEDTPISIWEEDFSAVKNHLDCLKKQGVLDLRAYFTTHPEALFECATLIRIVDVNNAAMKMYRADSKEQLIQSTIQVLSKGEQEHNLEDFIAIADGKLSNSWEGADKTLTGEPIEISLKWSVAPGHREDFSKVIVTVIDITERKRAEESLKKAEEKYRDLVERLPLVIYTSELGINGVWSYVSPQLEELLGFTPQEWMADPTIWHRQVHTEDFDRHEKLEEEAHAMGKPFESEYRIFTKDGRQLWIRDSAQILPPQNGGAPIVQGVLMDVTERRRAEDELRASEERFIQLANNIQEVFWMTDAESGKELYMSPAAEEIWGCSREYLMSEPDAFMSTILPEDLSVVSQALEKERKGEKVEIEYRITRPDGSVRWIWDRAFPILDDTGRVKRIAGVSADVTERRQAEDALQQSEEKYRKLAEQMPAVAYVDLADGSGNTLYISPRVEKLLGYSPRAWLEKPDFCAEIIHPEDRERVFNEGANAEARERFSLDYRYIAADGRIVWVRDEAVLIRGEDGQPRFWQGVMIDITVQKQAEEALRESEEKYRLLFESNPLPMWIYDLETLMFLKVNDAAVNHYGYSVDEFMSMTIKEIRPSEDIPELLENIANVTSGIDHAGIWRHRKKDGTLIHVEIISHTVEFASRPSELVLVNDITEREQAETKTRRHLAELEALYENGLAVGRLLKPSEIGDRIIETFARYLSWHHVAIRLKRPESDELELIALNQPGLNEQERAEMERHFSSMISKVDQGLSGWVIQTGEAIRTGNVHSHPQYVGTQEGIQSGLYMPLKIGERIIGSISVESEAIDAFSAQDERLLATLSNQAAIAFENARLYQSAQQELAERKRLQEQLDREHAQLKALFETIPDPIWLKDPHGKYLACNPVLEELINIPEAQIFGKTDYDLLDEKLAEHFKAKDQEAINRNVPMTYQEWVAYPNKQPRLMETVRTPMHDEKGGLIGVLGISHDITAMHNTQQELRESQELYRLLVETSPDGIGILGLDGTIIFANQQLADMFGMKSPFDCIGTNFLSLIAPEQHQHLTNLMEELVPDGVSLEEYRMVRKAGSRFDGEARFSLSLDKAGQPRWIIAQIRDITESKTARETIQEERQRFLELFENTPVAIWLEDFSAVVAWMEQLRIRGVTDLKEYLTRNPDQLKYGLGLIRILSVNQAAVEMNGARSKAHLLENFYQPAGDETPSGVMMDELDLLWKGKTAFEFEMTTRKLDDTLSTRILHVYIPVNNGKPDYGRVIIASTDISERVNTEKALQASETHYRELADSITDVFFEMDSDLHYIYWNKSSETLTGIMAKDAIGKAMREIFGETEEQARIEKIYDDVLRNHRSKTFETNLTLGNHQYVFEINAYPSTRGVSVVAKDVTDRKRSETIMQKRFELMEYSAHHSLNEVMQKTIDEVSQLTGSSIGFMHFVEADEITLGMQTWSTSTLQQFSVPVREGAHLPVDRAGVWADAVRKRRSMIQNDYDSLPNKKRLPEGHAPIIREMVIPIIRNEKTVAVLGLGNRPTDYTQRDLEVAGRFADYAWDITERKQMEIALADERNQLAKRVEERAADLIRANTNLARALRVKDEFLANMSHELRTPLNAILGLSESLGEQIAGPLNEKQQKYITTISESGRHLLSLINDILDLAKIEAGQITLDINRVDIQSVCEASLRMIKQLAQNKRQDVTLDIDDDMGLIWADERRLKQMMVNLLSNAVKFTPEGGKIGLEVHGNENENEVMITVWDNGIGMKEEDLSRLFQPFVQLDSGLARETTGTGLGLALVAQMVRLHGGSVRVDSHPEQGSRFTIVLPWEPALAIDTASKMKVTGKFRAVKLDSPNRQTVLLIEDTNEVIMMIRDYLELAGYQVITARDGVEGITQAQLMHPDLILMDVMMPRMDGLEATRRLRSEPEFEATPIIALTALAMPSDRERCISAGMNDYMSKPVNLKELVKTIQRFLPNTEEISS